MARVSTIVTNFRAGELSPRLEGRIDLQKYNEGAQTLTNMLVFPQGGTTRRPGTKFAGRSKDGGKVRLINFEYSDEQAYVLEFGANYIRFFKDGGILTEATVAISAITQANPAVVTATSHGLSNGDRVFITSVGGMTEVNNLEFTVANATANTFELSGVDSSAYTAYTSGGTVGKIVEVTTTYSVTDIFEINHAQSADVLYLAHKDHPPAKLTRTTATSFTLADIEFIDGPYLDENITDTTMQLSASAPGTGVTMTSTSDYFVADHVGALFRFRKPVEINHEAWAAGETYANDDLVYYNDNVYKNVTGSSTTTGNTPPVHLEGTESYHDSTTGFTKWEFQHNGSGYVKVTGVTSGYIATVEVIERVSDNHVADLTATITNITKANPAVVTASSHGFTNGQKIIIRNVVGMTEVNNLVFTVAGATTNTFQLSGINSTGYTTYVSGGSAGLSAGVKTWSEGAFSEKNGYPRAVGFYEQRLYFAGTPEQPQSIFGSVTADFENHKPGTEDDAAVNITIASDQVNVIKHLLPARFLQVLTTSSEFTLSGGTGTTPVTPTNVNVLRETTFGSSDVRPLRAGNSTILIQKGQEKVKEITFDLDTDGLLGVDLSILADHLPRGGLTDMVWQQEPELVLWFVHTDGGLIGLTYDRANGAIGWHDHDLGGSGIVESVTSIPSGAEDQVYVSVKRTIDGGTVRHIEYLTTIDFGDDVADAFYVDSGLTYDGGATTTISGLNHLEGETVTILADGAAHADKTVSGGRITLDRSASKVHVGYGYTSIVETLRLEAGADDGISQGKIKRIHGVTARFYNSVGAEIGPDVNNLDRLPFRDSSMPMDEAVPLYNGDKEIFFPSGYDNDARVVIQQTQPLPMTILAIMRRSNTFDA
jgi:hypothetical protein